MIQHDVISPFHDEPMYKHDVISPVHDMPIIQHGVILPSSHQQFPVTAVAVSPPDSGLTSTSTSDSLISETEDQALSSQEDPCLGTTENSTTSNVDLPVSHSLKPSFQPASTGMALTYGFSDGGFLESGSMATGWWITDGASMLDSEGALFQHPFASNNVAEYEALILCLLAARKLGISHFVMTMDSLLVVSQLKGHWACHNTHLQTLLQKARKVADEFEFFIIFHTYREDNTVADALCNLAFDGKTVPVGNWNPLISHMDWNREFDLIEYWTSESELRKDWRDVWSLVLNELRSIGPIIREQWIPALPCFDAPPHPIESITVIDSVTLSPLTQNTAWPYAFTPMALEEMKSLAAAGGLPWDPSRFHILQGTKNEHGVTIYDYPYLDVAYATLILKRIGWNLERLIHAWRGQVPGDMRPNKNLDFSRLENVTGGYGDQEALRSLIESGYELHWRSPYTGTRPLPKNHQSAELNHEIMGSQILKHYHSGRIILLNAEEVAAHVPRFTTSPYACVPKAHKPLTQACRPIHDQSSPGSQSVNANLDPALRPHAQWPASKAIADRILAATREYGTAALYGFNTDIADAFLNIGLHADDVPINSGILPASNIAALATTAIFGNCESPGAFRILNCVSHVHGSNSSYVGKVNTPFDVRFYVDDGNCIEPNVGDRLLRAEQSLRASTDLVFGPESIQEAKTTPWSKIFTSLGFEWNLHDGTTSIPKGKLERVRACLLDFSLKRSASVSEFRSIVGKLRHVATVCPPARALLHLLGLNLHSKHHINGRTHRPVTTAIREELRWWADHLSPATFYKLPVEWMSSTLPPVDQWIHVYSSLDVGVWLVDFINNASSFMPWSVSLEATVIAAIKHELDHSAPRASRMFHSRFIFNECGIARMINSGSSSNSAVQVHLRESCLWQLNHRHRFTATSTKWENMPDLLIDPCTSHISEFTNFLYAQISWTTKSVVPSPHPLINGSSPLSGKGRLKRMGRISDIGSHSLYPFSCRPSSLMNLPPLTNPRLWPGSLSRAGNLGITPKTKVTSLQLIKSKNLRSSGPINIIETPSSTSQVRHCLSLKPAIAGLSTFRIQNNLFMQTCCPAALTNSAAGTSPKGNWRGVVSYCNSSISEEQVSSGTPVDRLNTPCPPPTSTRNQNQITASKLVTWSSGTNSETPSLNWNITMPSQSLSPLITPRPIRWDEVIQSRWERLDTDQSARSRALSWPSVLAQRGKQATKIMPCLVELKPLKSTQLSKLQQASSGKIQKNMHYTLLESDTQPCYSKPDSTNSSSVWQDDGPVKLSPSTPAFRVACC